MTAPILLLQFAFTVSAPQFFVANSSNLNPESDAMLSCNCAAAQAGHLESVNVLAIVETGSEVQEQMNELEKTLVGLVEQMHRQLQILSQRLQNVMIDDVRPTPRRRKHNVH
ncbi:MAG: hypothetical protein MHM6MM_003897 [Cercozoa sp. M6MM]